MLKSAVTLRALQAQTILRYRGDRVSAADTAAR
jgi:hypothetical protein